MIKQAFTCFIGVAFCLLNSRGECSEPVKGASQKLGALVFYGAPGNEDLELSFVSPYQLKDGGPGHFRLDSKSGKSFARRNLQKGFLSFEPHGEEMEPYVVFSDTCFDGSDLRDFSIWRISLSPGNLSFRDADMRNSDFQGNMRGCYGLWDMAGADIRGAKISLTSEQLRTTKSYRIKDLTGWKCEDSILKGVDFRGFNLAKVEFREPMPDCDFTDAVIFDADCTGLTLEQIKSTWNGKYGHMDGVKVSKEVQAALDEEKKAAEDAATATQ